ncbi:MAG: metallophosphoesterase family protein [Gammaproteobacteria bacterium]|nr:metallophosphoesterase family protein [Gammaproteobacteria bacterium]
MIAILSDIHGNLSALRAVLKMALSLGCKRIISLGDVVGYHAQPGECIDLLRAHDAINIMGNHDSYLVEGTDCPRSKIVTEIADYQRRIISSSQVEWLSRSVSVLIEGGNYFTHGGWENPRDQYLYRVKPSDIPEGAVNLFTGHTHVQKLFRFGDRQYCNPGSVGQPRDGDSRAAFAVLSGNDIQLHRVEYDIDQTATAMKQAGFPPGYYENLYIGAQIGGRIDKVVIASNPEQVP